MDTPILLFAIFGIILWLDHKRRNTRIKKRWESVGGYKPFSLPTPEPMPNSKEFIEVLKLLNEIKEERESKQITPELSDDDAVLNETIDEVLTEMKWKEPATDNEINKRYGDAATALRKLGYKANQIKVVLQKVRSENEILTTEEIVTKALPLFI